MLLYKYYWNGIDHIYLFYIVCKTFIVKISNTHLRRFKFLLRSSAKKKKKKVFVMRFLFAKKIKNKKINKVFVMRFLFMTCWLFMLRC